MRMKIKRTCQALILVMLLFTAAFAEPMLSVSDDRVTVGDTLTFEVHDNAVLRSYTLFRNGEQINTGATVAARQASLYAQVPGDYVLTVQPQGQKAESVSFSIYESPCVTVTVDTFQVSMGEPIRLDAQVTGGAPDLAFEYSVRQGTERIYSQKSVQPSFVYVPYMEGKITLSVTVTDGLGKTAAAVTDPITVSGMGGITITGDLSPVLTQGAIRSLKIESPGPWKATTEQDFVTLFNTCGDSGDTLYYALSASNDDSRTAVISVSSAGLSKRVAVRQTETQTEEEELHIFSEVTDWITVNGQRSISWLCTSKADVLTVQVAASGSWKAETDDPAIRLRQEEGNELTVWVDSNTADLYKNSSVYLHSGQASAVIGISQPGQSKGAAVKEVILNRDRGTAYTDEIEVSVLTDASAQTLSLKIDQQAPILYSQGSAVQVENGWRWRFSVPLTGAGAQSWLFTASNENGSDGKALATVSVAAEPEAFAAMPTVSADGEQISVLVTQSTEKIEALDDEGKTIRVYTVQSAYVDRAADELSRYAMWTLPTNQDKPSMLRIGTKEIPVTWPLVTAGAEKDSQPDKNTLKIYSQMDGTWHNKAYRKSTLETSGCAIFALSHALQLLGHTEPESQPETLAKTYAFCLVDGGTLNATLIGNAGKEFGYKTRYKLYSSKSDIVRKFQQGAMFSFAIVQGHIALTDRLSADGSMCHIIDSAPTATFERIKGETPMRYDEKKQAFVPLATPADIPGLMYYVDTEGYDGAEYWLSLDYVAERGVRLIQP